MHGGFLTIWSRIFFSGIEVYVFYLKKGCHDKLETRVKHASTPWCGRPFLSSTTQSRTCREDAQRSSTHSTANSTRKHAREVSTPRSGLINGWTLGARSIHFAVSKWPATCWTAFGSSEEVVCVPGTAVWTVVEDSNFSNARRSFWLFRACDKHGHAESTTSRKTARAKKRDSSPGESGISK